MKLLATKKGYLLDADIEILHEQSNEWLSEIAFFYDEVAFLHSLVAKKTLKFVPLIAKSLIEKTESELTKLKGGELDSLKASIAKHEHVLVKVMEQHDDSGEEFYREKHRQLTIDMEKFERRFRSLKKEVFNLVELIVKSEN